MERLPLHVYHQCGNRYKANYNTFSHRFKRHWVAKRKEARITNPFQSIATLGLKQRPKKVNWIPGFVFRSLTLFIKNTIVLISQIFTAHQ
jgi:hypothetical protein